MNEKYMLEAIKEAKKAVLLDEVPIGCVAVQNGVVIERAFNLKHNTNDATNHAEILLLKQLYKRFNNWRLVDIEVYVTLEPCIMCLGALYHSRIKKLVYGAKDEKFGAISLYNIGNKGQNHKMEIISGVLEDSSEKLLIDFFKKRR